VGAIQDLYGRVVTYLRVSVTDRCNLRCRYCMPLDGVRFKDPDDVLSWDEFLRVVRAAASLGVRRIRITGGEPTTRPGLVDFVREVAATPGIDDVSMTTNGMLFAAMAGALRAAGLRRVNISLDSLRPDRFRHLTHYGDFHAVWSAVEAALAEGLHPVKINCVALRGENDDELADFVGIGATRPLHVRFIELMPLGTSHAWTRERLYPAAEIRERIAERFAFVPDALEGGGPARYYRVPGFAGTFGVITAMTENFCHSCNRVRLTADGELQPCLGSLLAMDLRAPLRGGISDDELRRMVQKGIRAKPERHLMEEYLEETAGRRMWTIGG
jgi:cyclic pyranopterin phosphate synthase